LPFASSIEVVYDSVIKPVWNKQLSDDIPSIKLSAQSIEFTGSSQGADRNYLKMW